jgi:hypothetical protein
MTVASYPKTLLASMLALTGALEAQVPGAPVLQNAFLNPGLGVAANLAGGSGQSYYGVAAGLGLGGGKLQVSGAAGAQRSNEATRGAYGGRAAFRVWSSRGGSLGAAAFAGVGGAPRTRTGSVVTNAAILSVPAGVTVAYQRALGRRGISVYASPFYSWTRRDGGTVTSGGTFRGAVGVDFSLTQSIGVTAGGELGGNGGSGGGTSGTFGGAVTFVPGRR